MTTMNDLLFNLRNRRNSPGISDYILFFLFPVLCFYLNMLTMFDSFWETRLKTELVNIFFYAVFLVLLFLLFNKAKTAIRLELFLVCPPTSQPSLPASSPGSPPSPQLSRLIPL